MRSIKSAVLKISYLNCDSPAGASESSGTFLGSTGLPRTTTTLRMPTSPSSSLKVPVVIVNEGFPESPTVVLAMTG